MKGKKMFFWIFLGAAFLGVFFTGSRLYADDTGDPPSSQSSGNIGAWYDESWAAVGFYRLEEIPTAPHTYNYVYTNTPTTNYLPTFTGEDERADTSTRSGHSHTYSTSASIPQDIVATEWDVTGHVHFKSGI